MSDQFVFSRVPGYDTFTGDRRVWTTPTRKDFVCHVINLTDLSGQGFRGATLPECKEAADYFIKHFKFPDTK